MRPTYKIPTPPETVSRLFAASDDELDSGMTHGKYATLQCMGNSWDVIIPGRAGEAPRHRTVSAGRSLEVVILRANPYLSRMLSKGTAGTEGTLAIECYSIAGVTPQSDSQGPKADNCANCLHNRSNSLRPEDAVSNPCLPYLNIAVAFCSDIANPVLLRVPSSSLGGLSTYSDVLQGLNAPYQAALTRIEGSRNRREDTLQFSWARWLTEAEGQDAASALRSEAYLLDRMIGMNAIPLSARQIPNTDLVTSPAGVAPRERLSRKRKAFPTVTLEEVRQAIAPYTMSLRQPGEVPQDPPLSNELPGVGQTISGYSASATPARPLHEDQLMDEMLDTIIPPNEPPRNGQSRTGQGREVRQTLSYSDVWDRLPTAVGSLDAINTSRAPLKQGMGVRTEGTSGKTNEAQCASEVAKIERINGLGPIALLRTAGLRSDDVAELLGIGRMKAHQWLSGHMKPNKLWMPRLSETCTAVRAALQDGQLPVPNSTLNSKRTRYIHSVMSKYLGRAE